LSHALRRRTNESAPEIALRRGCVIGNARHYCPVELDGLAFVLAGLVVLGESVGLVVDEAAPVVEGLDFMAGSAACEPLCLI
jgi:hypothetical protein